MNDVDPKETPKISRYAKIAAIAAWPLGLLLGLAMSSGQDAAGEGLAIAVGVVFGALASIVCALVWWFFRSTRRARFIHRYRKVFYSVLAVGSVVLVAWYIAPTFVDQQYSMRVQNYSSRELTDVEVRFAGTTIRLGNLEAKQELHRQELAEKPIGRIVLSWTNDEGQQQTVESRAGPPRWYEGGLLVVNILSEYRIHTYFVPAK